MPDLDKLYEKADKYLQRQKFEAAIETYQEILRYEPNDEEALINLGDLSIKLNRTAEALRYQIQLADHYIKRGDIPKAIATCKKVLKLSPQDVVTLMKLAGLLEKSQKNTEALEAYREALGHYREAGSNAQMFDCLTHIVKLDPNNLEEHVELAELASRSASNQGGDAGAPPRRTARPCAPGMKAVGRSLWTRRTHLIRRMKLPPSPPRNST